MFKNDVHPACLLKKNKSDCYSIGDSLLKGYVMGKNSRRVRTGAASRNLRNAQNLNRFLILAAAILVAGIFAGLRYQSKSFGTSHHPEGKSSIEDLQYYSGNKSFNENYQREKALKTSRSDEGFSQKEPSGTELNVPTSEQASNMEDKIKVAKSLIHQEEGAAKEDGTNEVAHPKTIQATPPLIQQSVSPPESPSNRVDVKPLPKLRFIKNATIIENRWSQESRSSFHISNAAVIDAGSKQATGNAGQMEGGGEINNPQTIIKDQ